MEYYLRSRWFSYKNILLLCFLFNWNFLLFAEQVQYMEYDPSGDSKRPYIYGDMKHHRHTKDMIQWKLFTLLKDPEEFLRALDTFQLDVNHPHKNRIDINYLMAAIVFKEWSLAEPLLDRGIDINWQNNEGENVLMYASLCGHVEFVRLLLEKGANPLATSMRGRAIHAARAGKLLYEPSPCFPNPDYERTIQLLNEAYEQYVDPPTDYLFELDDELAKYNQQLSIFLYISIGEDGAMTNGNELPSTPNEVINIAFNDLNLNVNFTSKNENNDNYLTFATDIKNWEYMEPLINQNILIDWQNGYGETALMYSSFCGQAKSVDLLLRAGANPNLISNQGHSALDMAKNSQQLTNLNCKSIRNYKETIKLLTESQTIRQAKI